ncbi:hypothetical protein [Solicola gregarius]|nr:hypothetical protein [Solicola gregarius]
MELIRVVDEIIEPTESRSQIARAIGDALAGAAPRGGHSNIPL